MNLNVFNEWRDANVVGVQFVSGYPDNLIDLSEEADEFESLELRRNPLNEYDHFAIEVRRAKTEEMLGHLPRPLAARIAPSMDAGDDWEAELVSVNIHPDHRDHPGLTIQLRRIQ